MNDARPADAPITHEVGFSRRRSFVKDGPPLVAVVLVFVILLGGWLGTSSPAAAMAVVAVGLVSTMALELAPWAPERPGDPAEALASLDTLGQRLRLAHVCQVERGRWR
jgi:hypothetical protein